MLMLSLIGIAIVVYLFLPAPVEKQGTVADILEKVQLPTEKHFSPSSSSLVVSLPSVDDSTMEMENRELELQYSSEDEFIFPVPNGGDW